MRRLSPVSLSVFILALDLLFDCSLVLEYAKIRTVLQSRRSCKNRKALEGAYIWGKLIIGTELFKAGLR